jgi:hypothetical protein
MLLISLEDKQSTEDVFLQAVSEISLKDLECGEQPLHAHLCDCLGIEEVWEERDAALVAIIIS